MNYSIDSKALSATIDLQAKDHLGYHNVPLCRAFLTTATHLRRHQLEGMNGVFSIHLEWDEARKLPVARCSYNYEAKNEIEERLAKVCCEAQRFLGNAITELIRVKENIEMVKNAEAI